MAAQPKQPAEEPLDAVQVLRARNLFADALMAAMRDVGVRLAHDGSVGPAEFQAGMFLAHVTGLASAVASAADTIDERLALAGIAHQQVRDELQGAEVARG